MALDSVDTSLFLGRERCVVVFASTRKPSHAVQTAWRRRGLWVAAALKVGRVLSVRHAHSAVHCLRRASLICWGGLAAFSRVWLLLAGAYKYLGSHVLSLPTTAENCASYEPTKMCRDRLSYAFPAAWTCCFGYFILVLSRQLSRLTRVAKCSAGDHSSVTVSTWGF